jgi:hypothetical protein
MAMKLGKHVIQNDGSFGLRSAPDARDRRQEGRAQMGNQGHFTTAPGAGGTGAIRRHRRVRDVHGSTVRSGLGHRLAKGAPAGPANMDWDLWIGPAPMRPYHPDYLPFKWRGWWDFGTGALGDMACHNCDAAFWVLELDAPLSIEAESSGINPETAPKWSIIRYQFPARGKKPPVTMTWYDGGKLPPNELVEGEALPKNGTIMVGSSGRVVFRDWNPDGFRSCPGEIKDFKAPRRRFPARPRGLTRNGSRRARAAHVPVEFDYAGTEMVLLGIVARAPAGASSGCGAQAKLSRSRPYAAIIERGGHCDQPHPSIRCPLVL